MARALDLRLCHVAGARPHLVTSTRHHGGPLLHARCGSAAKGQLRVAKHVEAEGRRGRCSIASRRRAGDGQS
ncbi:hypothetical protein EJB05_26535 [Eragrostis curvula]|uniref:Uncharacterized protein n=1 Tax=Eragrostis curvula TaxID=38414 RepID=A0A5J9UL15_9POAL|nr:hypothetical protein EJB05_26535 [Eragrostis curvula]